MKTDFSACNRSLKINEASDGHFDLAIIGGGITGAGVARDAASRGMKVLLVEKQDFAFGTSSRSSKLIHGGIRYLENLEFGLVFEALRERKILFEIAPHMVHPLRFILPLYKDSRYSRFEIGVGMWLYDALAMFDVPEMHEWLNPSDSIGRIPQLNQQDLKGSFVYSDAYMDDDRLVHESLRSAHRLGASCLNYVEAQELEFDDDGKAQAMWCNDRLSGKRFRISAKHFVSTVGPWTDQLANGWFESWKPILRPTKGIHLSVSRDRFPINDAVVLVDDAKNRIVFVIPRQECVLIGTTDTDFKGDAGEVRVERSDVVYLLKMFSEYFPTAHLKQEDIISGYAGVRPLVHDGSSSEGKTSREHTILSDPRNITFVAGGKYTTYRSMAEQIVDRALDAFTVEQQLSFGNSNTKTAINPSVDLENLQRARLYSERWSRQSGMEVSEVLWLAERHGLETEDLLRGDLNTIWQVEAYASVHHTMCTNLCDFYARRVPLFLAEADHGVSRLGEVLPIFSRELDWSEQQQKDEVEKLNTFLAHELRWKTL